MCWCKDIDLEAFFAILLVNHSMTILMNFTVEITNARKNGQKYDIRLWMAVETSQLLLKITISRFKNTSML